MRKYKRTNVDFGNELRMLRETRARLTQRELADLIGVQAKTIQNWEGGFRPESTNFQKLIEQYVLRNVFEVGREVEEARELWDKAGLNVKFDEYWLQRVISEKLNKEASANLLTQAREEVLHPSGTSTQQSDSATERQSEQDPQNQQQSKQTISTRRKLLIGGGAVAAVIATGVIIVPQLHWVNIFGGPSPTPTNSPRPAVKYHITLSGTASLSSRSWPLVYADNGPSNLIIVLQQMLLAHNQPQGSNTPYNLGQYGLDHSGDDGKGGVMTMQAASEFQRNNQCYPTGLIDPVTWEKLINPSRENDRGYQVKALQTLLNEVLSLNIPEDGNYTAQTRDAVRIFQLRNMHLPIATGDADLDTWCLLLGGKLDLPPIRITDSMKDSLRPSQTLDPGYQLTSHNGQFALIMQPDGELLEKAVNGQVLWISCTSRTGTIFWNQSDGNVTLRAPVNNPIWTTKTDTMFGAILTLQDDGHIIISFPNQPNRPSMCVSCQSGWYYILQPESGWT